MVVDNVQYCRLINTFGLRIYGRVILENLRITGTIRVGTGRVMSLLGADGGMSDSCVCYCPTHVISSIPPPHASPSSLASLLPPFFVSAPLSSRPSPSSPPSSPRSPRLKTCRRHPSLQATRPVGATAAQAYRHLVSCTSCSTPRQSALACAQTLVGYAFDCI